MYEAGNPEIIVLFMPTSLVASNVIAIIARFPNVAVLRNDPELIVMFVLGVILLLSLNVKRDVKLLFNEETKPGNGQKRKVGKPL